MKKKEWTVLTNHGRLLAYIAKQPHSTAQEIAQEAGLSIRAVQKIISDLERDGYIDRYKEGRRNRYTVNSGMPMRHRLEQDHAVGEILLALGYEPQKGRVSGKEVSTTTARV